jgi:hypothetical protein
MSRFGRKADSDLKGAEGRPLTRSGPSTIGSHLDFLPGLFILALRQLNAKTQPEAAMFTWSGATAW